MLIFICVFRGYSERKISRWTIVPSIGCYVFFLSFLGGSESGNRILHGGYMSEYPFSLYEGCELSHISVQVVQLSIGMILCGYRAFFGDCFNLPICESKSNIFISFGLFLFGFLSLNLFVHQAK